MVLEYSTINRTIWTKSRSQGFWNENILNCWTNDDWLSNLRMDKETFLYICEQLGENIKKEDTNFRKAVPVEISFHIAFFLVQDFNLS